MEQRKIQKRHVCSFCTKQIAKHLIPHNDEDKPRGIAFFKGAPVHPRCFQEATGTGEFREGSIKHNFNLENIGHEGEHFR